MTMSENVKKAPGFKQNMTEFMQKYKVGAFFQKYTMLIALVVVTIVFASWPGKEGLILLPPNITGLIAEKAAANEVPKEPAKKIKTVLVALVLILMMFPALENLFVIAGNEIKGSPRNSEEVYSFGNIQNEVHLVNCTNNYMTEDYEDTLFFKYLAKE
jgi:hypothetical protein